MDVIDLRCDRQDRKIKYGLYWDALIRPQLRIICKFSFIYSWETSFHTLNREKQMKWVIPLFPYQSWILARLREMVLICSCTFPSFFREISTLIFRFYLLIAAARLYFLWCCLFQFFFTHYVIQLFYYAVFFFSTRVSCILLCFDVPETGGKSFYEVIFAYDTQTYIYFQRSM